MIILMNNANLVSVDAVDVVNVDVPQLLPLVNVVVPLWNRGMHIKPLMENIQQIIDNTHDQYVKLWISDFNSTDIDLKHEITKYTYSIEIVSIDGPFIIGKALQLAAEQIKDPNQIIYFCDADSVFPDVIFKRIRALVVRGVTFYAPMVSRETETGGVIESPNKGGKGNIGVYVSDFVRSKGWRYPKHFNCSNLNRFPGPMQRTAWGGHDGHIYEVLKTFAKLRPVRPTELDQWVRHHNRDEWFSKFLKEGHVGRKRRR